MLSTAENRRPRMVKQQYKLKQSLFQQQGFFYTAPSKNISVHQPPALSNSVNDVTSNTPVTVSKQATIHGTMVDTSSGYTKQSEELNGGLEENPSMLTNTAVSTEIPDSRIHASQNSQSRNTITVNGKLFKFNLEIPITNTDPTSTVTNSPSNLKTSTTTSTSHQQQNIMRSNTSTPTAINESSSTLNTSTSTKTPKETTVQGGKQQEQVQQRSKQSNPTSLFVHHQSCTNNAFDHHKQTQQNMNNKQNTYANKTNESRNDDKNDDGYENLNEQVLMVSSIKQINVLTIDTKETNHQGDEINNSTMNSPKHDEQSLKVVLCSTVDYMALNTQQEKRDELDEPNSNVDNLRANIEVNELNQQQVMILKDDDDDDSKEVRSDEKCVDDLDVRTTSAFYENNNVNECAGNFSRAQSIITTTITPPSTSPSTSQTISTIPTIHQGFSSDNKSSFDTTQNQSVNVQYFVVKSEDNNEDHHNNIIKSQFIADSSDDDSSIHINIIGSPPASPTPSLVSSCTVYLRRHSVSTGDLLDIVGRRNEFGESRLESVNYKLSLSCNDIDQDYSLEDLRSHSEESIASHADDEEESESTENLYNVNFKQGTCESTVAKTNALKRQKAIRRAFKTNDSLGISVDAPFGISKAALYPRSGDRRHGIATLPIRGKKSNRNNLTNNEFVNDLVKFKRLHKKQKLGLFFTRSVNNLKKSTKKTKKNLLGNLFSSKGSEDKMEHLRETSILDDDLDEEILTVNFPNGFHDEQSDNRSFVKSPCDVTNKKVASIIEMYHNKNGEEIRKIEIIKVPGENLGFFIRFGNGIDRTDGIFISRVTLDSLVDKNNLLHAGDEILQVNKVRKLACIS